MINQLSSSKRGCWFYKRQSFSGTISLFSSRKVLYIDEWSFKLIKISDIIGLVWYMCLKTENYCLKTFVKICVGEKMYENT